MRKPKFAVGDIVMTPTPAPKFKVGDVVNLADGKRYRIIEAYFSRERGKYDYFVAPYGEPFYVTEDYISHA